MVEEEDEEDGDEVVLMIGERDSGGQKEGVPAESFTSPSLLPIECKGLN